MSAALLPSELSRHGWPPRSRTEHYRLIRTAPSTGWVVAIGFPGTGAQLRAEGEAPGASSAWRSCPRLSAMDGSPGLGQARAGPRQEWDSNPRRSPLAAFKTAALGHYATLPGAVGVGFEPTKVSPLPDFESGAIGRTRRPHQSGGCEIRTREGRCPTCFPGRRHRPD